MKKNSILLFFAFLLLSVFTQVSYAQTTKPSPKVTSSPTSIEDSSQIEKIKDLVASRVAELKLVEKRGVLGKVTQTTSTQITLTDLQNNKQIVDIDEITKFSDADNKSYGISDIKKGDKLGIIGLLNKSTEHILARFISSVSSVPVHFDGVITDIDKRNFTLTAVDEAGDKKILNIETSTSIDSFTKETDQIKSGFSKILAGQRVYASGFPDSKVANQLNLDGLIFFPELSPSIKMKRFSGEDAVVTPTAGKSAALTPKPTAR